MGRVSDPKERLMEAVSELIWAGSYGSTTSDQICDTAGVIQGSYYHFFDSKADLAVAALEQQCGCMRPDLDAIFAATVPPLDRFRKYCEYGYKLQEEMKAKCGRVLGCPLFTLGSEVSTQEDRLQKKVQEILDQKLKYLESAIRDAHAAGLINAPDASSKAKMLFAYYQGLYTQARINNDLKVLADSLRGTFDLLGVREAQPVAA